MILATRKRRKSRQKAVTVIFCLPLLLPALVHAAPTEHEQELEYRVRFLEKRLSELETFLRLKSSYLGTPLKRRPASQVTVPRMKAVPPSEGRTNAAISTSAPKVPAEYRTDMQVAKRQPLEVPSAKQINEDLASVGASAIPPNTDATPRSAAQSATAEEAPQELNVLRQNSVTLKPSSIEISTDLAYVSRHTDLQLDRGFLSNTSIRYGMLRWLELSLTVPFGYTNRTTNVGLGQNVSKTVSGPGDLLLQANARIVDQSRDWPGVVVSLGAYLPTGQSPYHFANYSLNAPAVASTPNPVDIFSDYFSQGDWGLRTNLQFYKTVDPFILFFGAGIDYFFPQKFNGYLVSTGLRYNYNFGFSFAASEKTTLGFTWNWQYLQGIKVNGRGVYQSGGEPTVVRLTIIQRVTKNTYVEPAVAIGVNRDAPDFAVGLGVRKSF